jgi:hypothetical protein
MPFPFHEIGWKYYPGLGLYSYFDSNFPRLAPPKAKLGAFSMIKGSYWPGPGISIRDCDSSLFAFPKVVALLGLYFSYFTASI